MFSFLLLLNNKTFFLSKTYLKSEKVRDVGKADWLFEVLPNLTAV